MTKTQYSKATELWQKRIEKLKSLGADSSYQFVVMSPKSFPFSGKFPVATTTVSDYPDGEDIVYLENERKVKHVIIIASPVTYKDLAHIEEVACHYKNDLGANYITLFTTYLMGTRQDKNINSNGKSNPINIDAIVTSLTYVDSFMVIEPNSDVTREVAAKVNKPLFPITPWKYVIDKVFASMSFDDPKNLLVVRPDIGRNIPSVRIAETYKLDCISFDKKRLSPVKTVPSLSPEDEKKVKDKMCILYDDEFNTFETVGEIAKKLKEYGSTGLIVAGVHGKFTGDWEKYVKDPIIKKIFITDSRSQIGNIGPYIKSGKIEVISLKDQISEILEADIKGTNFWTDQDFCHLVLQEED